MTSYLRYYDERYGDVYEIYVDHDGSFHSARRSIEAIGHDPIYYDNIEDIPAFHRNAIENMLADRQKKKPHGS